MSCRINGYYGSVNMQRNVLVVELVNPFVLDVYRIKVNAEYQYYLPVRGVARFLKCMFRYFRKPNRHSTAA